MTENYRNCLDFLSAQFPEVNGCGFYREVFPENENAGDSRTDFSRPNAIYLYRAEADAGTKRQLRRRIMLNDTWEQDYMDYVEQNPMTLCSGLSYRRRANTLENAQRMNALVFDLDGVGLRELKNLFYRFGKDPTQIRTLPEPTYIVLSGNGLHLYYVFDTPVDLYPNIKMQMKQLKYDLVFRIWEYKATSQQEKIQYQSINQGFRMVGSVNERYGTEIKAFRVGSCVTLETINQYVRSENRVDVNKPFRPSKMKRAEAKEKYPEWYERVVVQRDKRPKKWDIAGQKGHNGDELYNWWRRRVTDGRLAGGHRYYFLMCMAIYACKCDIPKKRLKEDMQKAFEVLKKLEHDNELTQADVTSALEAYSKEYYNFTIDDIEYLTDIRIERNKRNGRKQEQHIEIMNAVRDVLYPSGSWRGHRPSAEQRVIDYRLKNPEAKPKDCILETGLSKNTIYRWWDSKFETI
jgi:hypothetical protein